MKLLYTTDLHGNKEQYKMVHGEAIKSRVQIVINGGDLLPKTNSAEIFQLQSKFFKYLERYFTSFEKMKIYYLCFLGNDDLSIFDERFNRLCQNFKYVINIAQRKIEINGYEFIGMSWIVDCPFRIKDRCRKDTKEYHIGIQYGTALRSTSNGFEEIDDWESYVNQLPTIEDELKRLPRSENMANAIYVIHMPPSNVGLDICRDGCKVGSQAVYNFILKNQSKISLHGHIHESPEISGVWKSNIGKTICIQPGQTGKLTYVMINLTNDKINRIQI